VSALRRRGKGVGTWLPPNSGGLFEPILGRSPDSWPWALPHLLGVNTALAPVIEPQSASVTPEASSRLEEGISHEGTRFEVLGYWRGEYRVVHAASFLTMAAAETEAETTFSSLRVRYLLRAGELVKQRDDVEITGDWPDEWQLASVPDLGIFCAFLYERARTHGAGEVAEEFRHAVTFAWPPTEQLIVYVDALQLARDRLSPYLSTTERKNLRLALESARRWLKRG
jgi:hypothetical protein